MRCFRFTSLAFSAATWLLVTPLASPAGVKPAAVDSRVGVARFLTAAEQAPAQGSAKPASATLPDGDGKELTAKSCSQCHGIDVVVKQRHDLAGWNKVLDDMVSKGLPASDDDLDKIATYLAKYLGPDSADKPAPQQ
jgi:mono/diheme cytochrome c family protein